MATLYTQAEKNIRNTFLFISGFVALIIGLGWLFSYILDEYLIVVIAIVIAIVESFLSYWYSDKFVLKMTGAVPVSKEDNPELHRIVENLSITAGLPKPKIYLIDSSQPNAFATGRDPEHSAIAVTKGLLNKLERVELEGVISHEMAHIGNRDILLATVIVVLVGVVTLISRYFLRASFFSNRRRKEGGIMLLVLGLLGAILAPLAATLIRLAVSREREFLADATGALLTRYPEGLARALEKISADNNILRTADYSTAHLFIISPFKGKQAKSVITRLFSTHPPVEERIKRLRMM